MLTFVGFRHVRRSTHAHSFWLICLLAWVCFAPAVPAQQMPAANASSSYSSSSDDESAAKGGGPASASTLALPDAPSSEAADNTLRGLPRRIVLDELHVVQFPRYIGKSDLKWLLPLTAASVASFAFDEKTMSEVVSTNPDFNQASQNVSDGLRDGFIAAPIALFGVGALTHNDHARETGILGSEAMVDANIVGYAIKIATFRERPFADRSEGSFYRTAAGVDSSFISGHSVTAWSSAAVLAGEYPNRWAQAAIYTAATGVSLTRVLGQQHFPSDVLLGSAAGWLIGHYVYRSHHRRPAVR